MLRFRHSAAFGGNTTITVSFLSANSQFCLFGELFALVEYSSLTVLPLM